MSGLPTESVVADATARTEMVKRVHAEDVQRRANEAALSKWTSDVAISDKFTPSMVAIVHKISAVLTVCNSEKMCPIDTEHWALLLHKAATLACDLTVAVDRAQMPTRRAEFDEILSQNPHFSDRVQSAVSADPFNDAIRYVELIDNAIDTPQRTMIFPLDSEGRIMEENGVIVPYQKTRLVPEEECKQIQPSSTLP